MDQRLREKSLGLFLFVYFNVPIIARTLERSIEMTFTNWLINGGAELIMGLALMIDGMYRIYNGTF